jgi:hypothetical protein
MKLAWDRNHAAYHEQGVVGDRLYTAVIGFMDDVDSVEEADILACSLDHAILIARQVCILEYMPKCRVKWVKDHGHRLN